MTRKAAAAVSTSAKSRSSLPKTQRGTQASEASPKQPRGIPAPVHPTVETPVPTGAETTGAEDVLKKQELLQNLSDRTGLPKSRIRPVMDAMLDLLGEAIADERPLQLPPLGKVKPLRSKMQDAARVSHVKIRQVTKAGS